jgi:hypothetical protein
VTVHVFFHRARKMLKNKIMPGAEWTEKNASVAYALWLLVWRGAMIILQS